MTLFHDLIANFLKWSSDRSVESTVYGHRNSAVKCFNRFRSKSLASSSKWKNNFKVIGCRPKSTEFGKQLPGTVRPNHRKCLAAIVGSLCRNKSGGPQTANAKSLIRIFNESSSSKSMLAPLRLEALFFFAPATRQLHSTEVRSERGKRAFQNPAIDLSNL